MAAMERLERAHSHRSGGGGSEFFICFTARPSSSASSSSAAMRVPSSKSLMSPGRGRDPSVPSLSASLSRRLRSSGSVKGGQSPMFPSGVAASGGGRRKGCAFEAAEPSSPKVTCIGQVRVKSKKNSKGVPVARSRSQREASFRLTSEQEKRGEGEKNQSWVYQLPVSICEALRAFGSEFNCLVPCRGGWSPCSSRARDGRGGGAKRPSRGTRSCGAVFARWLMAIEEESEEEKRGEVVGLVVEGRDKGDVGFLVRKMETELEVLGIEEGTEKKEEKVAMAVALEEGRVSVCVPPRNALLLMRCRSDPVRVAALADRFWGSPAAAKVPCDGTKEEDDDVSEAEEEYGHDHTTEQEEDEEVAEDLEAQPEVEAAAERSLKGVSFAVEREGENVVEEEMTVEEEGLQGSPDENEAAGICKEAFSIEILEKQRNPPKDEGVEAAKEVTQLHLQEVDKESQVETFFPEREGEIIGRRSSICYSSKAKEGGRRRSSLYKEKDRRRHSFSSEGESTRHSFSSQREARRASFSVDREGRRRWSFCLEKEELTLKDNDIAPSVAAEAEHNKEDVSTGSQVIRETIELNKSNSTDENQVMADEEKEGEEGEWVEKRRDGELPDCLLMMMYEPKLSMEVSKETWVCSTDFDRGRPHHPHPHPHPHPNQVSTNASGVTAGASVVGGDDDCSKNKIEMVPAAKPAASPLPLPSAPAMASAIEQKVMGSTAAPPPPPAYGPFVLTRCKSEPVRSSARLAPDACFWRSRHLPIGAEGIGF